MRSASLSGWILGFAILSIGFLGCTGSQKDPSKKDPSTGSSKKEETSPKSASEPPMLFADVSNAVHLKHQYQNGEESDQFAYIESIGGGVAVFDYDRDGWQDLFFPGGGIIQASHAIDPLPGALWHNDGGKSFTNVTQPSLAGKTGVYSNGVISGDINSDGFPDLMVTGYAGLQLFVNQGDGTFLEVAQEAGLLDKLWSTSAGFGDLDNDGSLDIYIAHNTDWSWEKNPECKSKAGVRDICPPAVFDGLPDMIYMSNQDGTYRPVTKEAGLMPDGRGLAVMLADLNQDSKLDIYVANDTTYNFLFLNEGDAKFREVGVNSGTGLDERGNPNGSMGIALFDIDGNMLPDLWVTNYENETCALYKNDGNGNFRCVSSTTGIMAIGTLFVGFGTVAGDFDLDGDEDIAIANGHVERHPPGNSIEQAPLLLRNSGTGKLVRQQFEPSNYFSQKWRGRGLADFDYDGDGDLDLIFTHVNQPVVLLENQCKTTGKWCALELIGTHSNRDCIGTRVVFKTNKKSYLRNIVGGGSYLTQNPYRIHLGFPANEELQQAEITWPDGQKQVLTKLEANTLHRILEPATPQSPNGI